MPHEVQQGQRKDLYLGRKNPRHQYRLGVTHLESGFVEESLEILVDAKLTMNEQYALAATGQMISWASSGKVFPAG